MIRSIASLAVRQLVQTRTLAGRIPPVPVPSLALHSGRTFTTFLRTAEASSLRTPLTGTVSTTSCLIKSPTTPFRLLDAVATGPLLQAQPSRSVIKFSLRKGKRKTVKAVIKRFKRLDWGGWIRTISGRHKKMWRKRANRKRRLRQHVLVNAAQSTLLDKMVTKYWKRPRYYINDPYTPYHTREEFVYTRRKPLK